MAVEKAAHLDGHRINAFRSFADDGELALDRRPDEFALAEILHRHPVAELPYAPTGFLDVVQVSFSFMLPSAALAAFKTRLDIFLRDNIK